MADPAPLAQASCPECGAAWAAGQSCQDFFHQLLFWEAAQPALGEVHHLMVLCYHLQHPSLYSRAGLAGARELLNQFIQEARSPQQVRARQAGRLDSRRRDWKLTARVDDQGTYPAAPRWTVTAADVVGAGEALYLASVRRWAQATWESLEALDRGRDAA